MTRRRRFAAALAAALATAGSSVLAQAPQAAPAAAQASAPAPRLSDVASADAIVQALYAVISGDAGVQRDWDRFRSLFHPAARLIPAARNREGAVVARALTPEDYIRLSGPRLVGDGFQEREIARRMERFGHIAHVFSTYEARRKASDPAPFLRGVNSIQLFDDGARWWVLTVAWSPETPETPIPAAYLPAAR